MNKEQWDKHHKVMEWFYAEKGRSVICYEPRDFKVSHYIDGEGYHIFESQEPAWDVSDIIIPNDEYVEFRKAQIEGKTILVENDYGQKEPLMFPISNKLAISRLSIKPDEPEFKVGDWVREIASGFIIQAYADMVHKNFKLWEPQEGDVVILLNGIGEITELGAVKDKYVNSSMLCDFRAIPYIGQPFDQMK